MQNQKRNKEIIYEDDFEKTSLEKITYNRLYQVITVITSTVNHIWRSPDEKNLRKLLLY